jgi:hypothetical protein
MDAREAKRLARDARAARASPGSATAAEARAQIIGCVRDGQTETTIRLERTDVAGQSPTGPTPQQIAAQIRQNLELDGFEVNVSLGGDVVFLRVSWANAPDDPPGKGGGGGKGGAGAAVAGGGGSKS